jgi:hypothetical protein
VEPCHCQPLNSEEPCPDLTECSMCGFLPERFISFGINIKSKSE